MSNTDALLEVYDNMHVLYAALNGLVAEGGNEDARGAVANFAGDIMVTVKQLADSNQLMTIKS
jgi:hypothetical protein